MVICPVTGLAELYGNGLAATMSWICASTNSAKLSVQQA
jgi:hypothetical protein